MGLIGLTLGNEWRAQPCLGLADVHPFPADFELVCRDDFVEIRIPAGARIAPPAEGVRADLDGSVPWTQFLASQDAADAGDGEVVVAERCGVGGMGFELVPSNGGCIEVAVQRWFGLTGFDGEARTLRLNLLDDDILGAADKCDRKKGEQ